jgi:hypothetical protein
MFEVRSVSLKGLEVKRIALYPKRLSPVVVVCILLRFYVCFVCICARALLAYKTQLEGFHGMKLEREYCR